MTAEKKKVVIVGCGIGARMLVQALPKRKFHVTVIQPNTFAEIPWNCTSEITKKDTFESNSTIAPMDGVDETVFGIAVGCGDGTLAVKPLEEGKAIQLVPFDFIVCATGVAYPTILSTPGQSAEDRKAEVEKATELLTFPEKSVVLSGGGHIGVELAGDALEERGTDAKGTFTLVCSTDHLLSDRPKKYGAKALKKLEELGGTVLFQDRVVNPTENVFERTTLELQSGKTLECDGYIATYSQGPNTGWITEGLPDGSSVLPEGILNDKKQVIVDDYLSSKVYSNLFAISATNDRGEACVGMNIQTQAKTIAANIIKPKSQRQTIAPLKFPLYQTVGHKTYAFISPEAMSGGKVIFKWCGFPCNLLCPCVLCGCLCCLVSPMCCGFCCCEPEGRGFVDTLENLKQSGLSAKFMGYNGLGEAAPSSQEMER